MKKNKIMIIRRHPSKSRAVKNFCEITDMIASRLKSYSLDYKKVKKLFSSDDITEENIVELTDLLKVLYLYLTKIKNERQFL